MIAVAVTRLGIYDDGGPGVRGPWRLCDACAAALEGAGERRREIGRSFDPWARCEGCGLPNEDQAGEDTIPIRWRGPDYLYHLLKGHYAHLGAGELLEKMERDARAGGLASASPGCAELRRAQVGVERTTRRGGDGRG